jgi:hypothetical protein
MKESPIPRGIQSLRAESLFDENVRNEAFTILNLDLEQVVANHHDVSSYKFLVGCMESVVWREGIKAKATFSRCKRPAKSLADGVTRYEPNYKTAGHYLGP